jgi:hypothetical protein
MPAKRTLTKRMILDPGSVENRSMDLAVVLQRLYDSEINVTITALWMEALISH